MVKIFDFQFKRRKTSTKGLSLYDNDEVQIDIPVDPLLS